MFVEEMPLATCSKLSKPNKRSTVYCVDSILSVWFLNVKCVQGGHDMGV
jgi:hypothetical protein